ncbi:hypothetical protein BpHYR1_002125 [Brachionus plicatilis]|uniref:Uncharacterized protein n=1 Tax=Brachionus plicatilis TaxID=10195 RepID=A0A3M7RX66_BRAPC|nr:hypothetical protein BpHYR1_002125 [Brachionus plicatilis]
MEGSSVKFDQYDLIDLNRIFGSSCDSMYFLCIVFTVNSREQPRGKLVNLILYVEFKLFPPLASIAQSTYQSSGYSEELFDMITLFFPFFLMFGVGKNNLIELKQASKPPHGQYLFTSPFHFRFLPKEIPTPLVNSSKKRISGFLL